MKVLEAVMTTKREKGRDIREKMWLAVILSFLILSFPCHFLRANLSCRRNYHIFLPTKSVTLAVMDIKLFIKYNRKERGKEYQEECQNLG